MHPACSCVTLPRCHLVATAPIVGAVVSVVDQLGLPVKFIGVGETAEDLQPFDPEVRRGTCGGGRRRFGGTQSGGTVQRE